MKRNFTFLKTLLVAVGLLGGGNVWAGVIVGNTDYSTSYLGAKSKAYSLSEDGTWTFTFKNYNNVATAGVYSSENTGGVQPWDNFLLVGNNGSEDKFVLRADNYEIVTPSNNTYTDTWNSGNGVSFAEDLNGATVVMAVTRSSGTITVSATITPVETTHEFTKGYTYTVTDETFNLHLSVEKAYLDIVSAQWQASGSTTTELTYEYDFEATNPFVNNDGNRMTMSLITDATLGSQVVKFDRNRSGYVAFANFDFSDMLVDNAATVTVEFDYYVKQASGHDVISLSSAEVHTFTGGGWSGGSNTGYGSNGAIFNLGCFRSGGNNYFGVNSTQDGTLAATPLGVWSHAVVVVDNANRTVNYTLTKKSDGTTIKSATDIAFLNANATTCSQIDVYIGNASSGADIMIDNLSITSQADASVHNYTINAVCGGETIDLLASGMCTEGETFSTTLNKVIKDDSGNYYVLDDDQEGITNYTAAYEMGNADVVKEVAYTLDATIEYFAEGENCNSAQKNATVNDAYSGGYHTGYMQSQTVTTGTLSGGTYVMDVYVTDRFGKNPLNVYDATGTYQLATTGKGNSQFTGIAATGQFKAAAGTAVRVGLNGGNSLSFDYFIIRKVNSDATVSGTITPAGWATFSSVYPLDLSSVSGATAYYASAASGSTVTLTSTEATVPAGEGIMLKGTADATVTIPVAASGTAIEGNLLKGQTATGNVAASTDGKHHYVFGYSKSDATEYGFYNLAADTEVAAGKAYLETTDALAAARLAIVFDDETSGIGDVKASQEKDASVYDLSGRRVAAPAKGLYVVNGKKVIIK